MSDAPIQIRNPEVVRAIRRLAEQTGLPITEAVGEAVQAELLRREEVGEAEYRSRRAAIREIVERLQGSIAPVDSHLAERASLAFERFRGRAGGRLNLGDCFAYALAERQGD